MNLEILWGKQLRYVVFSASYLNAIGTDNRLAEIRIIFKENAMKCDSCVPERCQLWHLSLLKA